MDGGVDVPEGVTGGVVDLLLPVSTGTPRHMASAVERSLPTGRETIWVVDDEPELVELLTASLELLGYTVQGFDDGPAVISALALGHRPDLLTLDVRMPGMDGPAIHAAVRERGVLAPVLFCSALADVPLPDDERVGLMEKPFKLVELAVEVRRLIDRWVLVRQPGG
jgi:two-component system OmpR family response regulator